MPEADAAEPFQARASGLPDVRGYLHRPAAPSGDGLVLAHGAGGNCRAPLLQALAAAFVTQGFVVLRGDLPYRQARASGPPSPGAAARDRLGLRHAVQVVSEIARGRVSLGGQSYGGRQASLLAAEAAGLAAALLLLSYPLHPPGRPADLRTAHLTKLRTPALFVHGTQDPFGSITELDAARALIPAPTALVVVEGAGHDLGWGRAQRPDAGLPQQILRAFLTLVG